MLPKHLVERPRVLDREPQADNTGQPLDVHDGELKYDTTPIKSLQINKPSKAGFVVKNFILLNIYVKIQ